MLSGSTIECGVYVDWENTADGNLHIRLNRNGRRQFKAIRGEQEESCTYAALCALLKDRVRSGWGIVPPEDFGALTTAPVLSDDIVGDDHGQIAAP